MTPQTASGSANARATIAELEEERNALVQLFNFSHVAGSPSVLLLIAAAPTNTDESFVAPEESDKIPENGAVGGKTAAAKSTSTSSLAPASPSPEHAAQVLVEARRVVKQHISLLHEYNEIRDIGYGLLGMIADQRGVRLVDVMDEFGIGSGD